eukprot:XP_001708275.1 Hypothetical protein GL50803_108316 [Giardia lamblia ATCC 50803]
MTHSFVGLTEAPTDPEKPSAVVARDGQAGDRSGPHYPG